MTRELIEAAKAVCDDAERGAKGVVTVFGEPQSVIDAHLVASLRAAVRAAEAAPVADAERVREAANAAIRAIPGHGGVNAFNEWVVRLVADAIRPYIAPAPVADTVAVPVETLRELRSIATKPLTDQDCRNVCAAVRATVDALLPPPPAPEPSAELRERWWSEAMDVFHAAAGISREEFDLIEARREGYVARARAEWAKKGGG